MVVKYIRHIGFPSSIVFSQLAIMEDDVGRSESVVIRILVSDNGGTDYFGYVSYTSYLQPVVIVIAESWNENVSVMSESIPNTSV